MTGPPVSALRWAAEAIAPRAKLIAVKGLREGANPWLLRLELAGKTSEAVLRLGEPSDLDLRQRFRTEVAALQLAERHGLAAGRLIATDLDGNAAGMMAVLTTVLPGSSKIPRLASTARLRALGAVSAALHSVRLSPHSDLPARTRSLPDVDFAARRRSKGTTELLVKAEERLSGIAMPSDEMVFVHGDLWQGNTLWSGDLFTGMVDWDCAGAGPPGVDLGSLRCDAALLYGLPAAIEILTGWQEAVGRIADDVAYWDVVAALCTLADMDYCLPPLHDQGRTDLDGRALTVRRDEFLKEALHRLDHQ
jgi:aminoglycoside phosphotransferase (APT) family kinase protein